MLTVAGCLVERYRREMQRCEEQPCLLMVAWYSVFHCRAGILGIVNEDTTGRQAETCTDAPRDEQQDNIVDLFAAMHMHAQAHMHRQATRQSLGSWTRHTSWTAPGQLTPMRSVSQPLLQRCAQPRLRRPATVAAASHADDFGSRLRRGAASRCAICSAYLHTA